VTVAPTRALLDTCVVIRLGDADASLLPQTCLISAVTLAELSLGPLVAESRAVAAIAHGLPLATHNSADFAGVSGLTLIPLPDQ
jgi:predicted nucleic acid-binding protein